MVSLAVPGDGFHGGARVPGDERDDLDPGLVDEAPEDANPSPLPRGDRDERGAVDDHPPLRAEAEGPLPLATLRLDLARMKLISGSSTPTCG